MLTSHPLNVPCWCILNPNSSASSLQGTVLYESCVVKLCKSLIYLLLEMKILFLNVLVVGP